MDIVVARQLVRKAFGIARELQEALTLLKRELPESDYREAAIAIAHATHAVNTALLERAISAQPSLEAEIDANVARYGRLT